MFAWRPLGSFVDGLRVLAMGVVLAACLGGAALAMSVTPVVVDMAVAGRDARASISVVNDGTRPLPVEFLIYSIDVGPKGETVEKAAGDEFLVFPPQALVAPGATQIFRIQWVGTPDIKTSRSYIFSVNQIPVKMPAQQSGVQIVFNFAVVVNVAPPGGIADLKHTATGIAPDPKGVRRPAITVENSGTMHAYLSEASIELTGAGGWRKSLAAAELRQLIGLGLVQPGKRRQFLIPVDLPAGVGQVQATVNYKPKKAQ